MSFVNVVPELVVTAAQDLASIRSTLSDAAAVAAGPTTAITAAAQDEVSVAVSALFGRFGQEFRAISAQADAFHGQLVNMLSAGAQAYVGAEASAAQTLQNVVNGGPVFGPYESLVANTATNLQGIGNSVVGNTVPALQEAITGGIGQLGQIPGALAAAATGNSLPLQAVAGNVGGSYANLAQALTFGGQTSITSMTPTNVSFATVASVPSLLAWDLAGAPVNAFSASLQSGAALVSAVQAGNPVAALTALVDAPANVTNAFLNGSQVITLPPVTAMFQGLPTQQGTLSLSFNGLLVPPQQFLGTGMLVGNPMQQAFTVTGGPLFGGFLSGLLGVPELLVSGFP
ncbi:PE family protein [Mycobacterium sp. E3198]|uniref:PE family protein n=1 Tax=Mycobacterium sp. E3198 TaxID=1834143 RepID=UPI00080229E7|nr:PE family protein [Mycobacterium sp. E3198]OBG41539.1 hypothetical protein A5673_00745 [Mycobacterium sp. E3198]